MKFSFDKVLLVAVAAVALLIGLSSAASALPEPDQIHINWGQAFEPEATDPQVLAAPTLASDEATFSWPSGGVTVVVHVSRDIGMSDTSFANRCASRVAAMRQVFPPDPAHQ